MTRSSSSARALVFLLVLPTRVLANGGPATIGSEPGLRGLPVPYDESRVSLVAEELVIRLPTDAAGRGMEFEVEARYTLANRGKPLELLYAVPGNVGPPLQVTAPKGGGRLTLVTPPPPGRVGLVSSLQKGPSGPVSILIGGRRFSCAGKPIDPDATFVEGQTWCTTRLTIPTGEAVPMVLKYRDRLFAEGEEAQECAFAETKAMGLVYDFHPAGFWAGPVSRLQVRVELGNLDGLEQVKGPPGHRKEGATLSWDLKDVDLKTLPLLELSFDGNGRTLRTFAAKSPQRVAPRRPARCLAARVEVSAPLRAPMHGNQGDPAVEDVLCGVVLTLDSATPVRARTLRVGPCGDKPSPGKAWEVELPATDTAPVYFLKATEGSSWPSCASFCEFFHKRVALPRAAMIEREKKTACVSLEFVGPEAEAPCVTGLVPMLLSDEYGR